MSEDLTRFAVGTEERDIVGAVSALLIAGGIVLPKPRIRLRDILAAIDARDARIAELEELLRFLDTDVAGLMPDVRGQVRAALGKGGQP